MERVLSIQIRNNALASLSSASMGLIGLIGLSVSLITYLRRNNIRFSIVSITLLGFVNVISVLLLIIILVMPAFDWKDKDVYHCGNDYLIVQEQDSFVTGNLTYPRIIRTTSPYGMIRTVEEQINLKADDDRFGRNELSFEGKNWIKEATTAEK